MNKRLLVMSYTPEPIISDSKMVLLALVGGIAAFAIALVFISGGLVRHVDIFLPDRTYATLAFHNIDGETKIVGTSGIGGGNPTVLMRTGDFAMELTVANEDSVPHALYIEGLNVLTRFLQPGQTEVLTLYSEGEATYNYYDYGKNVEPLGQIRAVKVTMYE
ncbi:MAG: hypothetical protein M3299_00280 [Thermoproteota archaeon]|nr:hypothetical protein [Thermoproteota archaeon]